MKIMALFLAAGLSVFTPVGIGDAAGTSQEQDTMVLGKLYFVNIKEGEQPAEVGIKVMVFTHKADQGFYLQNALDDETPGYILACDLSKDPDADETYHWGSFYLHPEEVDPGFYDFVFLYHDRVFATMLTRFYEKNEIFEKSDSVLEELMSQVPSKN